jgi:hypothetical protein
MAGFQSTGPAGPSIVSISAKGTPITESLTLDATPGVETALVLPIGTLAYMLKAEDNSRLQFATTMGGTGTDAKFTVYPGFSMDGDLLTGTTTITWYIASSKASTVLQILRWTA